MDRLELHHRFFREAWPAKAKLTPTEALVWLAMWDHADANGEAFPAVGTIARYLGHASQAHVQKCRASLIKKGLLRIVRTGGGRDTSVYQIILPPAEIATIADSAAIEKTDASVAEIATAGHAGDAASPVAGNATQRVQERLQEKDTQKGEPPPFDFALPDEFRASHEFESLWNEWLATYRPKPATIRANLTNLAGLTVEQAIERVQYSLSNGKPAIYKNLWSEKNGQSAKQRGRIENLKAPILN